MTGTNNYSEAAPPHFFATTHWSVVAAAGDAESTIALQALGKLCATYWYPAYAFLRSRGFNSCDAEDMVQGFFAQLLERNSFRRADRRQGKFRFFLLGGLKNYVSDQLDRANAQKRGGGQRLISIDAHEGEDRFRLEPVDRFSPDKLFERRWALTLLDNAMSRLREEYSATGKEPLFDALAEFLIEDQDLPSYAEVATRADLTVSAVKSLLHRMRQRHRQLLREEIAQTVTTAPELEEEIRYLISVLAT